MFKGHCFLKKSYYMRFILFFLSNEKIAKLNATLVIQTRWQ